MSNYPATCQSASSLAGVGHWQGELHLHYRLQDGLNGEPERTVMSRRCHSGPFTVQRSLYPEGPVCHTILLHPPGGLVEGDSLSLFAELGSQAHSFITTPSAGKVYECDTAPACQTQQFKVADNAVLEWFPQEMILYNRAICKLDTRIDIFGGGQYAGWEIICLGRAVCHDTFASGGLIQTVELFRDGQLNHAERLDFTADSTLRCGLYGLAGHNVMATFMMTGTGTQHLDKARDLCTGHPHGSQQEIDIGFTQLDDLLIGRVLANQSRHAKLALMKIYAALRPAVLGLPFDVPRIWAT